MAIRNIKKNQTVRTWEASQRLLTRLEFSPDGNRLAYGDDQGNVTIRTLADNRDTVYRHPDKMTDLTWLHRDQLASGSHDGTVLIQSLAGSAGSRTLRPCDMLTSLAVHPATNRFAAGSMAHHAVLFDLNITPIHLLQGHTDLVARVDFSPDGRTVATISADGSLKLWSATTGSQLLSWRPPTKESTPLADVRFAPDGTHLAVAVATGEVHVLFGSVNGSSLRSD